MIIANPRPPAHGALRAPLSAPLGALGAPRPRTRTRRHLTAMVAASLALVTVLGSSPAPVAATTSTSTAMAASVLSWLNADRAARGLVPLRAWPALATLAVDRATRMAATGTLSHAAAGGSVGTALTARGIRWYGFGENIGASGYPWGLEAAGNLYSLWKGSPTHHAIMFSGTFNYIGIGFAYRPETNTTFASMVLTESPDHTPPVARNVSIGRSGTTIRFSWSGSDPRLQTHTAGLRSFDVQYRVDNGTWRTIRNDTTSTALWLSSRPRGHWYGFRVQAADRRGNLSRWTSATRVWVP